MPWCVPMYMDTRCLNVIIFLQNGFSYSTVHVKKAILGAVDSYLYARVPCEELHVSVHT